MSVAQWTGWMDRRIEARHSLFVTATCRVRGRVVVSASGSASSWGSGRIVKRLGRVLFAFAVSDGWILVTKVL